MPIARWSALLALLLISILGPRLIQPPAPQNACNFVQNVDQRRVSWKTELPIHLNVHKSVPPEAREAIQRAVSMYRTVLGREMFVVDVWGSDGDSSPQKDGHSTIHWLSSWEKDRAKEQARTTLYWNGDQIYEADIRINAANFRFNFEKSTPNKIDLESLMIHELGHVLGLTHDATHGSVMNFSLNEGEVRRHLGTINLTSLHCEY